MKQLFSKKILLFWALMLAGLVVEAAEPSFIKLESIEEDASDSTEKYLLEHSEYNKNKNKALIKISTNLDCSGFEMFNFGSIGKGIIECKGSIIYVYAPAGASKLQSVGHKKAGQEMVSQDFPGQLQLKAGKVYLMVLKPLLQVSPLTPNPLDESLKQQYLVAECSIPGATIDIQGYAREAFSNGMFQKLLPLGSYKYQVDAPRYQSETGYFDIISERKTPMKVTLTPNFATVTLSGDGDIYVNEERKASNRWTGELTKGTYKAELRKPSHRSSVKTFDVEAGKNLNITLDPPAPIYGKLNIEANTIAQIYIDGKNTGETTPAILQQVLTGSHTVELRASGYENAGQSISIEEGKMTQLSLTLKKEEEKKTVALNDGIEMVFVQGGAFRMGNETGSSDEKPVHSVRLSDYYIGKYEVTQKQWEAVMGNNPSRFKGDNLPVESVSWNDVQEFIKKLNAKTGKKYRLPTEAEWEYAARGGNQSKGYTYSGGNTIGDVAWYSSNSSSTTHEVGAKRPNELGVYDMSGNVWEWCSDWYDGDYYKNSPVANPAGAASGSNRVFRGGCWNYFAEYCTVSYRDDFIPDFRYINLGFRLALAL